MKQGFYSFIACPCKMPGSAVKRAAMLLLLGVLTTMTAWANTIETYYLDASGTRHDITATVLTGNETLNTYGSIDLAAGWYVVNSDIEYTNTFSLYGEVHLILADGKTMNMSISNTTHGGIYGASSFAIYGQTAGTGKLIINNSGFGCDGIRLYEGTVTINGGIVDVFGKSCGILTQDGIIINGGNVTATTDGLYGLWAYNSTITLSWRSLSDRITVSEFNTSDHVVIADGKYFKDANSNYY